jgi:pyruvate/2-oxoglutarate dehydrogenase complex dihydrolipoamide acyltransferase (E2) component
MSKIVRFPRDRRHTYFFLERARENAPILLDTDIDMSSISRQRKLQKEQGVQVSYISYLIKVISGVVAKYPQANSSVKAALIPCLVSYERVVAKFTLDKTGFGERLTLAALVKDSDKKSIEAIQQDIDYYKTADYENSEAFAPVRKLNALPLILGRWLYGLVLDNLSKRQEIQGSFTVTSLGHSRVNGFFPISSTTLAFGVGEIKDSVVVVDGEMVIRPMMRLSMVFDHRAIDGAMAADILNDIGEGLERYGA